MFEEDDESCLFAIIKRLRPDYLLLLLQQADCTSYRGYLLGITTDQRQTKIQKHRLETSFIIALSIVL